MAFFFCPFPLEISPLCALCGSHYTQVQRQFILATLDCSMFQETRWSFLTPSHPLQLFSPYNNFTFRFTIHAFTLQHSWDTTPHNGSLGSRDRDVLWLACPLATGCGVGDDCGDPQIFGRLVPPRTP